MGIMNKKSKKSKKFDSDDTKLDEKEDHGYDIEASDDEMDEVPSKWYDEVSISSCICLQLLYLVILSFRLCSCV